MSDTLRERLLAAAREWQIHTDDALGDLLAEAAAALAEREAQMTHYDGCAQERGEECDCGTLGAALQRVDAAEARVSALERELEELRAETTQYDRMREALERKFNSEHARLCETIESLRLEVELADEGRREEVARLRDQLAAVQAAGKVALHEMTHTVAPRNSFTDAVDALDAALSSLRRAEPKETT